MNFVCELLLSRKIVQLRIADCEERDIDVSSYLYVNISDGGSGDDIYECCISSQDYYGFCVEYDEFDHSAQITLDEEFKEKTIKISKIISALVRQIADFDKIK